MRVVVVANSDDADDGLVGQRLKEHGATFTRLGREHPESLLGAETKADLLVLLGSDWSVYDPDHGASVRAEKSLVHRAQALELPILGICFGGQLISAALGLNVTPTESPEIGWRRLRSHDVDLVSSGPWFQYHFDRWTDGKGITSIADSIAGPQAYWHGKTLALQFHPEVTTATIERWCTAGREVLCAIGEDFEAIMQESRRLEDGARERCNVLVDHFLYRVGITSYPVSVGS